MTLKSVEAAKVSVGANSIRLTVSPTTPNLSIAGPYFVHSSLVTGELANQPGTVSLIHRIRIKHPYLDNTHTIPCIKVGRSTVPCQGFDRTSMSANGFKLPQGGCGVAQDGRKIPENRAVSEGNGFGSTIISTICALPCRRTQTPALLEAVRPEGSSQSRYGLVWLRAPFWSARLYMRWRSSP
jgi:hypothetical protein